MTYENLIVDIGDDFVGEITLNRPEQLNTFNTPLAGVVFALEVVMMEYSLASFVPIILAAVSANAVSILVLGSEPAFSVPRLQMGSLAEMPLVLLLGVLVGAVAAGFIQLLESLGAGSRDIPFWQRTTLAGILVGLCALAVPEVMGIGYDTVTGALLGNLGLTLMAVIAIAKLFATAAGLGLGLPAGLIGPTLSDAIGYPQFMPTNILAYGKDGNDDGNVDLLNHADSMASIANFLKRHGWRPGISREKAEKVIYHYNHSEYYVNVILKIANLLTG